jgi:radical SAM protein with 4Fe4S-binding SPASM domain
MPDKQTLPTDVSIITTYRCCMRCKMCHIWKYPTDIKKEIKPKELEILPDLKFINITGGEPFVRKDIEEIIEVAFKKAPRVVISTAGYQVDQILALAEKFPRIGIRVSIEGLSTINDYLRGRKSGFDRGIKTLMGLQSLGIKDIGFGITVSNNNSADMLELYELSKKLKMEFATAAYHNSYYFHKEDNKITNEDVVIDNFYELIDRLLKEKHPKSWFRAFFNLGLINYIKGNRRLLPCEAGTVNFFIEPYGDVYPCNGLEEKYWKESMGNIRDFDTFDALWQSAQAQRVRELVATCPKNCWMVGTAAPVMKKYIKHPLKWACENKMKSIVGLKVKRGKLPASYNVGQNPLQGDLRGDKPETGEIDEGSIGIEGQCLMTRVLSNEKITKNAILLEIERNGFDYKPGQNASIGPHLQYHKNRDYSFYSSPKEDTMKFLIRIVKQGEISPGLMSLKAGDKVDITGPYGEFGPQCVDDEKQAHLFIASGVGVGPFRSFIKTYPDLNYKLIHGVRYKQETEMARSLDETRYISCVTAEDDGTIKGRVTDYLTSMKINPATFCYICGNPYMLRDVSYILREKGIPENNIFTEPYYAY